MRDRRTVVSSKGPVRKHRKRRNGFRPGDLDPKRVEPGKQSPIMPAGKIRFGDQVFRFLLMDVAGSRRPAPGHFERRQKALPVAPDLLGVDAMALRQRIESPRPVSPPSPAG